MSRRPGVVAAALPALLAVIACGEPVAPPGPTAEDYVAGIETWRAEREERLAAPDGWLSLVALEWLEAGANPVGPDDDDVVRVPGDAVSGPVGTLIVDGTTVRFDPAGPEASRIGDDPVTEAVDLLPDVHPDGPTVVSTGRLTWYVIERDGRLAVRVKDPESPARLAFAGIEAFPVDPVWRVEATFVPHAEPVEVRVPTVVDTEQAYWEPGRLELTLDGREVTLTPLISEPGDDELFIMFRDGTSGSETYGAGRYLYATLVDGTAVVDFNRAYNPPCAFSPYATCPLPPPENRLPLRVTAGEKSHGAH